MAHTVAAGFCPAGQPLRPLIRAWAERVTQAELDAGLEPIPYRLTDEPVPYRLTERGLLAARDRKGARDG